MKYKIEDLKRLIKNANRIVFFGGAGVSTESGIPDFRSTSGLYGDEYKYELKPEKIISVGGLYSYPELFYKFYKERFISLLNAQPNITHLALAELEKTGKLAIITQNIDGLHQKAGSINVIELHGTLSNNYCQKCRKNFSFNELTKDIDKDDWIPYCDCGGIIRPNIVLFGEFPRNAELARNIIKLADLIIVGGTSLKVQPASSFLDERNPSSRLVIINDSETDKDEDADLVIKGKLGDVFRILGQNS